VPASFLSQLTHITVLNLNHNKVGSLLLLLLHSHARFVDADRSLTNATLQIRDLPEEMSQLTKLEELRLAENQLEVLPGWVARMVALKIVDLRYNERLVSTLHATSTVCRGACRWLSLAWRDSTSLGVGATAAAGVPRVRGQQTGQTEAAAGYARTCTS
jgi:Leucine-rich repeat (LRR) protein